jgi:hypothetical protein
MADTVLVHPNRDKASSQTLRGIVFILLVVSAALILIVTLGGWEHLQGAQPISFAWAAVYLVMAWQVARWNRGVLPVAAALAILFAVIAAVAGPAWFERDKAGFDDPALEPAILGVLTVALVPIQLALATFGMIAFQQQWHVEVEVTREEADRYYSGGISGGQLTPVQP